MYQFLQTFHSHNRNMVLLIGVILILLSLTGMISKQPWNKFKKILSLIWMIVVDIQCTIGLALYFGVSSFGLKAFSNPNINVMKDAAVRKIAIEHLVLMLAAWIIVHIGYSKIKSAQNPHKTVVVYYGIAMILMLAGIPWGRV